MKSAVLYETFQNRCEKRGARYSELLSKTYLNVSFVKDAKYNLTTMKLLLIWLVCEFVEI